MLALKQRCLWILAMLTLAVAPAWAGPEDELKSYVDNSTQLLVDKLNAEKSLYSEDPEAFYKLMEETLDQFVDFRRIAARVMGRYARQTTPEQRDEFVERFKRSLFDAYAQALVNADDFQMTVQDAEILPNNSDRASVQMQLTSASGSRIPITYSMFKNNEDRWMMENLIVEGVNIGLAFRDRFAQEMEQNRGQIQLVIDGWGSAVESLDLNNEEQGQS
ncbi:MlaC/ttg2D family ABC transporter substrate-binding protein [Marinobacter persicus]|uniref:Phospholipid transport system substrate-binding protein n=1 Tax=Marinobacter persicus TaxID=930118 RepID=A0A2S6G9N1_9GAMM|nr:ABC transporter substrate-binding protein [Marinobacter persicus]PPK52958.1 phospholipid transport system substrate-binding protein [Marinobacter persicus]PPK55835.1 phospholipid transport system substrate-binding protein [Marinobacter persicus]PPK59430.1 phospholipid transport system substrate-binding protein [Marinobacter persicus]